MTNDHPPMTVPDTNAPEHAADNGPSFLAQSKKAVAGGVTAAVAAGASALGLAAADGNITVAELWTVAGAVVGGFLVGALGVWGAPANATKQ